jgi:CRISPR-associated protein Cas5d
MIENTISVRVWGDFACFTRPEMKVERVSYPLMTPSAARGVLEAIFWEPEVHYLIDSIRVLKKGTWVSLRRNEIITVVSVENARTWMKDPAKFSPIQAGGGGKDGTQRNMLALEDVEYIITAEVALTDIGRSSGQKLTKYLDEIKRRTLQGKCFHRPYLGMREFATDFEWEFDPQAALERRAAQIRDDGDWRNIWPHEHLGLMLYDVFYPHDRAQGFRWLSEGGETEFELSRTKEAGKPLEAQRKNASRHALRLYEGMAAPPQATFFRAEVKHARMECHPERVGIIKKAVKEV